ncbi:penicillin-binding protein 2 [bacterium]|nr:penicillin-binding protein 2 [bacterium]
MKNNLVEFTEVTKRLQFLSISFFLILLIIIVRLLYLQILKGDYFYQVSEENRIQLINIPAPRGIIYDHKKVPLVKTGPSFDIMVTQIGLNKKQTMEMAKKLSKILGKKKEEILLLVNKKKALSSMSILVAENVPKETMIKVAEQRINLPGVIIQVSPKRFYVYGELASHLLGYIGEVSEKEIEGSEEGNYKPGDLIGKTGVEKLLDEHLKGEDGGKQVEVDAKGRELRILNYKEPIPGRNVYLTIDFQIQKIAEEAMKDNHGAVVIINSDNGKILTLISKPSFNPNIFTTRLRKEKVNEILNHPYKILMNRAIQAQYSPGSVFKIVVMIAALENNKVNLNYKIRCQGKYYLGNKVFKCWKKEGHGAVSLIEAITKSCNVYFYNLGRMVGINPMVEVAKRFNLGEKTHIILPNEKRGLIPSPKWKKENFKEKWYQGETINMSIGQGYTLVTPIQLACLISGVSNQKVIYQPLIIEKVESLDRSKLISYQEPVANCQLNFKEKTLQILDEGLKKVVKAGTGWNSNVEGLEIGGKTGTSQNPHGEDHAWFVCYTHINGVNLAMGILVEHGGMGGKVAAPIAGEILSKIKELP